jgi:Zn ribbon nucleic-acid-binding protein
MARIVSTPADVAAATCPRCGSARMQPRPVVYADGPVLANLCLECGYFDLQQLPTYISPKVTTKVSTDRRRLPTGTVLGIARQAGIIDDEHGDHASPIPVPEHT